MLEVIAAILTDDSLELQAKLAALEGKVGRVQVDIVDGQFAKNKTIMPDVLQDFETSASLDFQLMTREPVDWIERCVRGMADRIFGHVEMMASQRDFVGKVSEFGLKVGLALDLPTPVSQIEPEILNNLDAVLVMSVKAGFGGQKFDPSALKKVRELDEIRVRDDTPFRICVDGGINEKNIAQVRRAGADEVAIGAHLFAEEITAHLQKLQRAAHGE